MLPTPQGRFFPLNGNQGSVRIKVMRPYFLIILLQLNLLCSSDLATARVRQGVADFAQEHWHEIQDLSGEWRFFPKRFLKESDLRAPDFSLDTGLLVQIPGVIDSYVDAQGQPLHPQTWGTFLIKVRNLHPDFLDLGLSVRGDTAYDVFVLDIHQQSPMIPVLSVGQVGSRPQTSIPEVASPIGLWRANGSGDYFLVIHLSGFHYPTGGLWTPPEIGRYAALQTQHQTVFLAESLAVGMILVMMFYHLMLYVHRREDKASLVLSLFSFSVLLRTLGTSPNIVHAVFPEPSRLIFEIVRKCEFASLGILGVSGAWFALATFPIKSLQKIFRIGVALGIASFLFCLLTPARIYPRFVVLIDAILLCHVTTYIAVVAHAKWQKAIGSNYLLIGGLVMAMTVVYDVLIGVGLHNSPIFLSPFGMVILLFSNGQIIADLFAYSFRTAQRLTQSLQEAVERKTRNIRTMLDHIPQGVMGIIHPGVADEEYSAHLKVILGIREVAGHSIQDLLLNRSQLDDDERAKLAAVLDAVLNEDLLNFELNAPQLLRELILVIDGREKNLHLDWAPIVNKDRVVEKIQLTLHDFTHIKAVETQNKEQGKLLLYIQELLPVSSAKFAVFAESSARLLQESRQYVQDPALTTADIMRMLSIHMHTLKGSARTIGLNQISALAHDMEQRYKGSWSTPLSQDEKERLLLILDEMQSLMSHYRQVQENMMGRDLSSKDTHKPQRDLYEQLVRLLTTLAPYAEQVQSKTELAGLMSRLESQIFQDLLDLAPEIRTSLTGIAHDLKRPDPKLIFHADGILISYTAENLLRNILVHILRNAMDHGIEPPEQRLAQGKSAEGTLTIHCDHGDDLLSIRIQDDGRGLPLSSLRSQAEHYGVSKDASPTEIAELIFQSGLSTAEQLTETSGRGIGMEAIRLFLREIGGEATIELLDKKESSTFSPFCLVLHLPAQHWRRKPRPGER
jgi:signal transduction histidine kinase